MDRSLFQSFRELAYDKAGIALKQGKEALVSARIGKRMRKLGIPSERDYLSRLQTDHDGEELVHFLDAISTNFTSFFRERDHFEVLESEARQWVVEGRRRVRIWSAASSSGEEPYSIAITLAETLDGERIDYRILATDIAPSVLERARVGVYGAKTVEPVPAVLRAKYFDKEGRAADAVYRLKQALRDHLVFKRLNLSAPPFPMSGPLDLIFCRNVMIYFDSPVRQNLIQEAERLLRPGGLLVTGHSETLAGLSHGLRVLRPSIYRKPQ